MNIQNKIKKKSTKYLEIRFDDVITLRTLIDVIKDFLGDINIECKKDPNNNDDGTFKNEEKEKDKEKSKEFYGIKIVAVNPTKTLIIIIKLESTKFGIYRVSKPVYDVGINLSQLYKLIRSLDKDDILTMSIESDDKQTLLLDVENETRNSHTRMRLKTLDIDKKAYKIPDTKFDMVVTMESSEFHRICKDLAQLSEYVEIVCKKNSITFNSVGDCAEKSITIDASENNGVKIKPIDSDKPVIVQGYFELKYFTMFQKCSNLCPNILIYVRNNYPIFIKYLIASLGQILVGIVPVNNKNVNTNFSDEDDDYSDEEINVKNVKNNKKNEKEDNNDDNDNDNDDDNDNNDDNDNDD